MTSATAEQKKLIEKAIKNKSWTDNKWITQKMPDGETISVCTQKRIKVDGADGNIHIWQPALCPINGFYKWMLGYKKRGEVNIHAYDLISKDTGYLILGNIAKERKESS